MLQHLNVPNKHFTVAVTRSVEERLAALRVIKLYHIKKQNSEMECLLKRI